MNHQTLAKIRQDFTGTLLSALRNVLFCEANLQIIGSHHEAIAAELIAQFNPQAQDKYAKRRDNGQITKWDHLYLADDSKQRPGCSIVVYYNPFILLRGLGH